MRLLVWDHELQVAPGIAAAALAVQPPGSRPTLMAKMTPNVDFCSLEMHPNAVVGQYGRTGLSTILEDVVGEYRAKTHIVCLPVEYYARHLRHGDAAGGNGAVIRLDHSSFPRSVFETPNEFNVWLTSQLTWQPQHPVDELWRDWTSRRYGDEAAPLVRDALKHTADVWEHSTNSFGFYCTSAHGCIAPFFEGPYNAYGNLVERGPRRASISPAVKRRYQNLLHPDQHTLEEVVRERDQAVRWAEESLAVLEGARAHMIADAYGELVGYLQMGLEAARLWRELGDLFFTGLAIRRDAGLPADLVTRLCGATERALRQGRRIEQRFGKRHWPVAPDADGRGTELEPALAGLWGMLLDRHFGLPLSSLGSPSDETWQTRQPRSDAERVHLGLLRTAAGLGVEEMTVGGTAPAATLRFEGSCLIVESAAGGWLQLPVATAVRGPVLNPDSPCEVHIRETSSGLEVEATEATP